jgi:hypothetical protein
VYEHKAIREALESNVQHYMDGLVKEYEKKRVVSK